MTVQNHQDQTHQEATGTSRSPGWLRTFVTLLFIIVSLALMPSAHALRVDEVQIHDEIAADGSVQENVQIILSGNTLSNITFTLPPGADSIEANGKGVRKGSGGVEIPLACATCNISLTYRVSAVVSAVQGNYQMFSRTINFPHNVTSLHYEVALPIGQVIGSQDPAEPAVVPAVTDVKTDGQHIIVSWTQKDPELPQKFQIIYYRQEGTDSIWHELSNEFTEWIVWAAFAILFALGIGAGILLERIWLRPFTETDLPYIPASLLSPDEKTILKALKAHHGKMTQKELGKSLSWSKSKVSAIMTGLERKKIVKREKIGRNFTLEVVREVELD